MKRPLNYKPKFSLSIVYLKKILTKRELDVLMDKYVEAKIKAWGKYNKKKMKDSPA